jgi:ABC-type polysaccharide/polyol phosphate transport system ATPase subunit
MSSSTIAIECQEVVKKFKISNSDKTLFGRFADMVGGTPSFEELTVLDGVSFEVNQGEVLGVIGKNGAGKTTLLRLIANTIRPDKGTIKRNGNLIPLLELGTGFDFNMTARENIHFYGTILGFKDKEIKTRSDEILRFAELEGFADVKIKKFSTGMIARLAFSTAAQIEPDILLLDEVLSVGDLPFQQKSYKALNSFREKKRTVIFVSHNLQSIRKLCDRLILLHNGKISSTGEPEKVIDDYLRFLAEAEGTSANTSIRKTDNIEKVTGSTHTLVTPKPFPSMKEISEMVNKKEFANAYIYLKDLLKNEPNNGHMHYLFAFCLQNLALDYSKALHHYNLALEFGFQKFWVLYGRGSLLYKLRDFEAAREDLETAISLNPKAEGPRIILHQLIESQQKQAL